MNKETLLGIGLDNQYFFNYPGSMTGLCEAYSDRLSHISIVSLTTVEEAKKFKENIAKEIPVIHHFSGIAPCDPDGPNLKKLFLQAKISEELEAHWCLEDIGIWSIGPYDIPYFVPPPFFPEVAELVAGRINKIIEKVNIPFLAEIPSCSFVVGKQSLGDFFWHLVRNTNCKVVLDVSHVYSYSLATNKNHFEVLQTLPLDAVWEIHIAGGKINKRNENRYIDTHSDPVMPQVEELLKEAIRQCKNLKAITYEIGMKSTEDLISSQFLRLETIIKETDFKPKFS